MSYTVKRWTGMTEKVVKKEKYSQSIEGELVEVKELENFVMQRV